MFLWKQQNFLILKLLPYGLQLLILLGYLSSKIRDTLYGLFDLGLVFDLLFEAVWVDRPRGDVIAHLAHVLEGAFELCLFLFELFFGFLVPGFKVGILHKFWLEFFLALHLELKLELKEMLFEIVIFFFKTEDILYFLVLVHVTLVLLNDVKTVDFILQFERFFHIFVAFSLLFLVLLNLYKLRWIKWRFLLI